MSLATPHAQGRSFELMTASIADIQSAVDAGKLTYEGLVGLYLKRIDAYDKKGPSLRAAFDSYLRRRGPASPVKTFAELFASGKWLKGGVLEARFNDTMKAGDLNANVEYQARLLNQRMMRQVLIGLMGRGTIT